MMKQHSADEERRREAQSVLKNICIRKTLVVVQPPTIGFHFFLIPREIVAGISTLITLY